ncbi:MAG TPA: methyltransferase dimerization domain-containing protein, partial [Bacteroidota bacterium]|nr:methyltransferase dimerization domain-containing protein [Bacteroidota bacterium]
MPAKSTIMESLLRQLHLLPTPVMDTFGGIIFERALMAGLKKGVFEALARGPLTAEEISGETHLHPEAARLMADAYVAGGYLKRRHGKYSAGAETRKWLLRSSPSYIGNLMLYFETLHRRLGGFEHSITHGKPPEPYYKSFSEEDWEIYSRGMADLARLLLGEVFRRISVPKPGSCLLDIGGSHGVYALEFCRRFPGSTAVVMDFEGALGYAEALV